jgi:ABC-2 type transport system permease protein
VTMLFATAATTAALPSRGTRGSALSTFTALLRREFWEHRGGLWSAQIWTTVVLLILMVLSILIGEAFRIRFMGDTDVAAISVQALSALGPDQVREFREGLRIGLWGLGMVNQIVLYFVVLFYCIGALYDERKDRSILFWKSLPATDTQTVLSKLVTAIVVAPVIALVATAILHVGFLLLVFLYLLLHGVASLSVLWQPDIFLTVWAQMAAAVPVQMLWAVPGIAWLLLASSWAKRAPFVWAVLVPLLAGIFVGMIDGMMRVSLPRMWFWEHVVSRIFTAPGLTAGATGLVPWRWRDGDPVANLVSWDSLGAMLANPATWIGLVVGAGLLAAAIWLRRYRDDS